MPSGMFPVSESRQKSCEDIWSLVFGCEESADYHDYQCRDEDRRRHLMEQYEWEAHTEERSYRIEGAGFGCAERSLCRDIIVNAHAVGHKAEEEYHEAECEGREGFAGDVCDYQGAEAWEESFDEDYLERVLVRDHSGAVVLQTPEDAGGKNEEGTEGEADIAEIVDGKQYACDCDEEDCQPQALWDYFFEYDEGYYRSCDYLEVV